MSPLRRFWLSYGGDGWLESVTIIVIVLVHLIVAVTAVGLIHSGSVIWQDLANNLFLKRPPILFMLLPGMLGFMLRLRLDTSESLALVDRYTRWHIRICLLGLLPLVATAIATFVVLIGGSLLQALSVAASMTVLGAWVGCGSFWAILATVGYSISYAQLTPIAELRAAVLGTYLILALAGVMFAWHHLHHRHWRELRMRPIWPQPIEAWFDRLDPAQWPTHIPAEPGLPGLRTMLRLVFSSLTNTSRLHLYLLLLSIAGWFLFGCFAHDANRRLFYPYVVVSALVCGVVGAWSVLFRKSLRLMPMSRQRGAAAVLLGSFIGGLVTTAAMVGGMILGLLAADLSRGAWPTGPGVWLLAPFAVAAAAATAATAIIWQTISFLVAFMGTSLSILGGLLILPRLLPTYFNASTAPPTTPFVLLGIASGIALLLIPLAWYRLNKAELP